MEINPDALEQLDVRIGPDVIVLSKDGKNMVVSRHGDEGIVLESMLNQGQGVYVPEELMLFALSVRCALPPLPHLKKLST